MPTVTSNRATFVKLAFRGYIGFVGKLWSLISTEVRTFATHSNRRHEFEVISADAKQSKTTVFSGADSNVLAVYGVCQVPQIHPPVIRSVAVNVIDLVLRPFASHVKPSQTVGAVNRIPRANKDVARCSQTSGHVAGIYAALFAGIWEPSKYPGFRVVMQDVAHLLRGKIGLSHDALLMLIGQRPARVDSACGLRYFNVGGA